MSAARAIKFCLREVEFYRHASRVEVEPEKLAWYLRRCADDLEESVILLEELANEDPDQLQLPLGWELIDGGDTPMERCL